MFVNPHRPGALPPPRLEFLVAASCQKGSDEWGTEDKDHGDVWADCRGTSSSLASREHGAYCGTEKLDRSVGSSEPPQTTPGNVPKRAKGGHRSSPSTPAPDLRATRIWAVRATHSHSELLGKNLGDTQCEVPPSIFRDLKYLLHVTQTSRLMRILHEDLVRWTPRHGQAGTDDEPLSHLG